MLHVDWFLLSLLFHNAELKVLIMTNTMFLHSDNKSSDYDSSSDPEALERGTEAPYVVIDKMDRKYHDSVRFSSFWFRNFVKHRLRMI